MRFLRDRTGLESLEYLAMAAIAVGVLAVAWQVAQSIKQKLQDINNGL